MKKSSLIFFESYKSSSYAAVLLQYILSQWLDSYKTCMGIPLVQSKVVTLTILVSSKANLQT